MFRIVICDDCREELNSLAKKVQLYMTSHRNMKWQLFQFQDAAALADTVKKQHFDLYILDIRMPELSGIALGKLIRDYDKDTVVIYTTSFREYAFEAFGIKAMAYLEKPVTEDKLFPLLEEAVKQIQHFEHSKIIIKTKKGILSVEPHMIIYVENVSRTAVYHMKDGSKILAVCNRATFEKSVEMIASRPEFLHPHKSFFVNMDFVCGMEENGFLLEGNIKVPISRKKNNEMKKAYLSYMAQGGEDV